jgi:hypothetical protein
MFLNWKRREIGGASGQSHFGGRLSFDCEELTVARTSISRHSRYARGKATGN